MRWLNKPNERCSITSSKSARTANAGSVRQESDVNAPALKTLFADLAAQRKQFAEELKPHLYRLGGLPDGGSNAAALHRGWMLLRDFVPGHHDHAIVVEAERGEHAALTVYKDALNGMLPPTVTDLVEAQREAIQDANERIRTVETGHE